MQGLRNGGIVWMFSFAFFQFTPLYLCPLIRPPFALLYIVLAISQSTNDSYSSINGGDCVPVGDGELKLSECRNAFLSLSLFILLCLPYVFIPSLSFYLSCTPPPTLSQEIGWLASCWMVHLTLPVAAYANRIINFAPDYVTSLHLPAFSALSPSSASLHSNGLGWANRKI